MIAALARMMAGPLSRMTIIKEGEEEERKGKIIPKIEPKQYPVYLKRHETIDPWSTKEMEIEIDIYIPSGYFLTIVPNDDLGEMGAHLVASKVKTTSTEPWRIIMMNASSKFTVFTKEHAVAKAVITEEESLKLFDIRNRFKST